MATAVMATRTKKDVIMDDRTSSFLVVFEVTIAY